MDRLDIAIAACQLVTAAAILAFAFFVAGRIGEKLLSDCTEHCAGRDMVVASHTIYGCECREGDD